MPDPIDQAGDFGYGPGIFAADQADAAKLANYQSGVQDKPWFENLLTFGATKAIDVWGLNSQTDNLIRLRSAGIYGYNGAGTRTLAPGVATKGNGLAGSLWAGGPSIGTLMIFAGLGFLALKAVK